MLLDTCLDGRKSRCFAKRAANPTNVFFSLSLCSLFSAQPHLGSLKDKNTVTGREIISGRGVVTLLEHSLSEGLLCDDRISHKL
jgi:hypothetical protein